MKIHMPIVSHMPRQVAAMTLYVKGSRAGSLANEQLWHKRNQAADLNERDQLVESGCAASCVGNQRFEVIHSKWWGSVATTQKRRNATAIACDLSP